MKVNLTSFTVKVGKDDLFRFEFKHDKCSYTESFLLHRKEIEFLVQDDLEFTPAFVDLSTFIYLHHNFITIAHRGQEWIEIEFRWPELKALLMDLTFMNMSKDKEYEEKDLFPAYEDAKLKFIPKAVNKTDPYYMHEVLEKLKETDEHLEAGLLAVEKLAERYSNGQDDIVEYTLFPDFKDIGFALYNQEGKMCLRGGLIKYDDGTYHTHT